MLDPGGLFILMLEIFTPISPSSISPNLSPLLSLLATTLLFSVSMSLLKDLLLSSFTGRLLRTDMASPRVRDPRDRVSREEEREGEGSVY